MLRDSDSEPLLQRQADLLRRGQREGHLRADLDPYLLAVTYQRLVDTMLDDLSQHPDIDSDRYAEHTAAVVLDGIIGPTRGPSESLNAEQLIKRELVLASLPISETEVLGPPCGKNQLVLVSKCVHL